MNWRLIGLIVLSVMLPVGLFSADADTSNGFYFTTMYDVPTTSVKNQAQSGTCWSFAGASFIESEILRITGDSLDISEMFFVRMNYPQKATKYIRYHGNANIESGSLFGDVLRIVRTHGFVPENVYPGLQQGDIQHDHSELDAVLKASLDAIISNSSRKISPAWPQVVNSLLDIYLGPIPTEFTYRKQNFTPQSFSANYKFDTNEYIEITSYAHHPFDTEIVLEIPDNWAANRYLNVPLDEFMAIIDRALENGYSVGFDGDVSEKSFKQKLGVAILPELVWELRTEAEKDSICRNPEPELMVDQKIRQISFDNYTSKDDHLMHIVGIAKDQNGTKYYKTKNSWGTKDSEFNGYTYMSESYVRSKTISILVSKEVLDK
jgi:bleomycin hydrolase